MRLQGVTDTLGNLSLSNPHRVLIVGCAYGGVSAAINLLDYSQGKARQSVYPGPDFQGARSRRGVEITVIDERDGYFHSVGAPLAHVTPKYTNHMWKRFSHLNELKHPNLHFKHGSVKNINPEAKVAEWCDRNGKTQQQAYDYLVMATGLKRHFPAVPKSGSFEEYQRDSKTFIEKITGGDPSKCEGRRVVVIGAGAVGVEFAAEIKQYYPQIDVTLVHSRSEVLSSEPLPADVKERAKILLEEEGVKLALGSRATITDLPNGQFIVTLANKDTITADFVIDSTKKGTPTTDVLPTECLNDDKEIMVHQSLMFKDTIANSSSHFGVGDVIAWSGIKRAGSATVMGQAAAQNIYSDILNSELAPSSEQYIKIELPAWDAVIGLAVGKQCLTYDPKNGIKYGVEVMKGYFGEDLGWSANLKYLGLTDVVERADSPMEEVEATKMAEVGIKPDTSLDLEIADVDMVHISQIKESNVQIDEESAPRVAVFVGGTSGIGKLTLNALARLGTHFKAYVIGRQESEAAFKPFIEELHLANANASIIWVEGHISLLSEVKRTCDYIKELETSIDLLFMTAGYVAFNGRQNTSEGLEISHALEFYSRICFAQNLLPVLRSSDHARVMSVRSGGMEGDFFFNADDLLLEAPGAFGAMASVRHMGNMNTLALERIAEMPENKNIVFMHCHPGSVRTGNLFRGFQEGSWGSWLAAVFMDPVIWLMAYTEEEAAERYLYQITSAAFGGKGVPLGADVVEGKNTKGERDGSLFLVHHTCETTLNEKKLKKLRVSAQDKVWVKTQEIIGPYV
ncbi:uncharacterized protein ALTATR162_LOCUS9098 [Alternaria atra]|uniref:FAD/NAD(P)-binding domain-containing protein n=1 Tax=Alternaria atra TaxID=119953 RepID=A0A8J2IJQ8_9PLEO|nr:uncharacterized protein ALTATR162_LOCUS9098 [Alternaria atra]CAG5179230.1 unnamed protein product [Alternaria atra]